MGRNSDRVCRSDRVPPAPQGSGRASIQLASSAGVAVPISPLKLCPTPDTDSIRVECPWPARKDSESTAYP